jgi:hypothetical protein
MNSGWTWNKLGFQVYVLVLFVGSSWLLRLASLPFTDYKFIYGLDDPYIHLALSERITRGEYGINRGEIASPSSSVIYPFLLTWGFCLDIPEAFPFWLSLISMAGALWMVAGFIWDRVAEDGTPPSHWFIILGGVGIVFSLNAPTFPMIGMEHPLHILGTVMVLRGIHGLLGGNKRDAILVSIGSVLVPLARYEGIPLGLAGVGTLILFGHYRAGLLSLLGFGVPMGAHMFMLWKAGLPLMPSSVMAKSGLLYNFAVTNLSQLLKLIWIRTCDVLDEVLYNVCHYPLTWVHYFTFTIFFLLALMPLVRGESARYRYLWLLVVLVLYTHLLGGGYGALGRYEAYAVTAMVMGLGSALPSILPRVGRQIAFMGIFFICSEIYVPTISFTPSASTTIYVQQYQMHRFATGFFPYPVALNDLGWMSYGNKAYILDLAGLASDTIRVIRQRGKWTPVSIRDLALQKGIVYAMIYRSWMPSIPSEWCLVGVLKTFSTVAGDDKVSIYLINPAYRQQMEAALDKWEKTLPIGARLYRFNCLPDSAWHAIRDQL